MLYKTRHHKSTSGTYCDDESDEDTSKSSESREKGPIDEENRSTTAEWPVPESTSGGTGGNIEEREDDPSAPLPGGPIDRSLVKRFKIILRRRFGTMRNGLGPPGPRPNISTRTCRTEKANDETQVIFNYSISLFISSTSRSSSLLRSSDLFFFDFNSSISSWYDM
ncbi:hypothetical protein Scep_002493 [Stephania cephalantha]|uniref:Uncharacterized protein n=1 Tax=Stephania cephalantha TaxID=152367 RepID=A0AAP0Q4C5_9MAGN